MARKRKPLNKLPEPGDPPTPETARKLRADVLLRLKGQGKINGTQMQAAEEIVDIWQSWLCAMFQSPQIQLGGDKGKGLRKVRLINGQPTAGDIFDWLPEDIQRAWRSRYCPWANAMRVRAGNTTVLDVVLSIAADNNGVHQTEKRFGLRNGSAVSILQAALNDYARMAGWLMAA